MTKHYIPHNETVDGYRHAYTVEVPQGHKEMRYARTPDHPADPMCPACPDRDEQP